MLQTLKNWFQLRRKRAPHHSNTHKSTPKIVAEQVHLHWHVSDVTPIPGQVTWNAKPIVSFEPASEPIETKPAVHAAFDEALLERARTQWQFGDWESLAKLTREDIEQQSERAKLALLVGAAHLQLGNDGTARQLILLAKQWGCEKRLISRILIAGTYNSLGKAAACKQDLDNSIRYFKTAISTTLGQTEQVNQLSEMRVEQTLATLASAPPSLTAHKNQTFSSSLSVETFLKDRHCQLAHDTVITLTSQPVSQKISVQPGLEYYIEGQITSDVQSSNHALAVFEFLTHDLQPITDSPIGLLHSEIGFYSYLPIKHSGQARFFITFTVPETCFFVYIGFRIWGNHQETIRLNSTLQISINTNHWSVAYDSADYRRAIEYYQQAYQAIDEKRYIEAVKAFRQAEELAPQCAFPYWLMRQKQIYNINHLACLDEQKHYSHPWAITEQLFVTLLSILPPGSTILELGSGIGTRELCRYYQVVSIEHNPEWLNQATARYIHAPLDNDYWYDASIIKENIKDLNYDLLLVDGPPQHRRIGFIDHLDLFKQNIPIIIDDIVRIEETYLLNQIEQHLGKSAKKYFYYNKGFALIQ